MELSGGTQKNPRTSFHCQCKICIVVPIKMEENAQACSNTDLQATRVNSFTETRPQVMLSKLRLKCNMGKHLQACWWLPVPQYSTVVVLRSAEAHGEATALLILNEISRQVTL